jgi:hypothetical protein
MRRFFDIDMIMRTARHPNQGRDGHESDFGCGVQRLHQRAPILLVEWNGSATKQVDGRLTMSFPQKAESRSPQLWF